MKIALRTRLVQSLVLAVLLFIASVCGYMLIEDYTLGDAVYMSMITLSTVGFGEVRPLSPQGRIFTTGIIVTGVVIIAVLFGNLTEYIVAGEMAGTVKKRRLMRKVQSMKNHYIICGLGRIGEQVALELHYLGPPLW